VSGKLFMKNHEPAIMSQNDPMRNLPLVKPTEPRETTAANWQIVLTTIAIVAILAVFFWGINNQRGENSGEQATAPQATPATPQSTDSQSGQAPASTTTGVVCLHSGYSRSGFCIATRSP